MSRLLRRYAVTIAGQQSRTVEIEDLDGGVDGGRRVQVSGRERTLDVRAAGGGALFWLDGARVVEAWVEGAGGKATVSLRGQVVPVEVSRSQASAAAYIARPPQRAAGPVTVRATIPGRVARILVKLGDRVAAGSGLAVLEAMKMENEVRAPRSGTVREIRCAEGAAVEANQELVVID